MVCAVCKIWTCLPQPRVALVGRTIVLASTQRAGTKIDAVTTFVRVNARSKQKSVKVTGSPWTTDQYCVMSLPASRGRYAARGVRSIP